jgi:hypothetical protein
MMNNGAMFTEDIAPFIFTDWEYRTQYYEPGAGDWNEVTAGPTRERTPGCVDRQYKERVAPSDAG